MHLRGTNPLDVLNFSMLGLKVEDCANSRYLAATVFGGNWEPRTFGRCKRTAGSIDSRKRDFVANRFSFSDLVWEQVLVFGKSSFKHSTSSKPRASCDDHLKKAVARAKSCSQISRMDESKARISSSARPPARSGKEISPSKFVMLVSNVRDQHRGLSQFSMAGYRHRFPTVL